MRVAAPPRTCSGSLCATKRLWRPWSGRLCVTRPVVRRKGPLDRRRYRCTAHKKLVVRVEERSALLQSDDSATFAWDSVMRILTQMYKFGLFDNMAQWNGTAHNADVTSIEKSQLARELAAKVRPPSASGFFAQKDEGC